MNIYLDQQGFPISSTGTILFIAIATVGPGKQAIGMRGTQEERPQVVPKVTTSSNFVIL